MVWTKYLNKYWEPQLREVSGLCTMGNILNTLRDYQQNRAVRLELCVYLNSLFVSYTHYLCHFSSSNTLPHLCHLNVYVWPPTVLQKLHEAIERSFLSSELSFVFGKAPEFKSDYLKIE